MKDIVIKFSKIQFISWLQNLIKLLWPHGSHHSRDLSKNVWNMAPKKFRNEKWKWSQFSAPMNSEMFGLDFSRLMGVVKKLIFTVRLTVRGGRGSAPSAQTISKCQNVDPFFFIKVWLFDTHNTFYVIVRGL